MPGREEHPRPRPFPPTPLARCVWPPPGLEEKLQAATGTSAPLPRLAGPSVLWHHDRAGPDSPRRLSRRLRRESEPVPPEAQSARARRRGRLRTFRVQRFGRSTPRPLRRGGLGGRAPPRRPKNSEFRGTSRSGDSAAVSLSPAQVRYRRLARLRRNQESRSSGAQGLVVVCGRSCSASR